HHEAVYALEKILVILDRLKRMQTSAGAHDRKAAWQTGAGLINRQQMPGIVDTLDAAAATVFKNVIAQALLMVQRRPVDTVQLLHIGSAQVLEPGAVVIAEIISQDAVVLVLAVFSGGKRGIKGRVPRVGPEEVTGRLRRACCPVVRGLGLARMRREDNTAQDHRREEYRCSHVPSVRGDAKPLENCVAQTYKLVMLVYRLLQCVRGVLEIILSLLHPL